MQVYLPVAAISVDALTVLVLGTIVGFMSGLFGVGGGFLMTPLLIFLGVPPAIAVGTQANQLVGASVSGVIAHTRRGGVDFRMGSIMLAGGLAGSLIGVAWFGVLQRLGQIDLVISLMYVLVLGAVGSLMLVESVKAMFKRYRAGGGRRRLHQHYWLHGLPWKMRFPKSRLYISALAPLAIGLLGGVIVAIMGVGGGFFMVPAMIYLLGMPTAVVAGTSLFQIIFVTAAVTVLHAVTNHTVDIVLALLLLVGGVVGAQFGSRFASRLRGEQARALLALLVLTVAVKLGFDLIMPPADLFSYRSRAVMKALGLLALILALANASQARAQALIADLTSHLIAITTGFTGTDVVLFGAIDSDGDVMVVVRGPETAVTIRRKEPVLGIWLNRTAVTFSAVPQYYAVAATRPLTEIAQAETLHRQQIGIDYIALAPQGRPSADMLAGFRAALIEGKIADGLWLRPVGAVKFIGGRLFRTTIALPANVPTGRYQVTTYLLRRGEVVAAQATPLLVSQLGMSAEIASFAYRQSLWYGIVAVLLAAVAGWGASLIFRRR